MNYILRVCALVILYQFKPCIVQSQDILYDSSINTGLYDDFFSFRQNNPSLSGILEISQTKGDKKTGIFLNDKLIDTKTLESNYWGFSYSDGIYVNVNKFWYSLGQSTIPKSPFYIIKEIGFYSLIEIETKVDPVVLGGIAGGALGGLIGAAIEATDNRLTTEVDENKNSLVLLAMFHETGEVKIITKYSLKFILAHYPDLMHNFEKEERVTHKTFLKYLKELNRRKLEEKIIFNERKQWPVITIVRKTNQQSNNELTVKLNDQVITNLNKLTPYLKDTIPPNKEFILSVEGSNEQVLFKLNHNQKFYFEISDNPKKGGEITIKKIDYIRAKYSIDIYNSRK